MNLLPGELHWGVAPALLIDCAQQLHATYLGTFTFDDFCEALGAHVGECRPVLERMIAEGFVSPTPVDTIFRKERRLSQLALGNVSYGIQRHEAEALLTRVIEYARQLNESRDEKFCQVTALVVFGSYLGNKQILGDIDIGVVVGRHFKPWPNGLSYDMVLESDAAVRRTRTALRLRKPKQISIHDFDEVKRLGTPYQVVYGQIT